MRRENRKHPKFSEGSWRVGGVDHQGIEYWEMRLLGDGEEPSWRFFNMVRTLAYFDLDEKQLVGFEPSDIE